MHLEHAFRVVGEPAARRSMTPVAPVAEHPPEYEAWYVDARHQSAAALWLDGTLWLGGAAFHVQDDAARRLPFAAEGPPHLPGSAAPFWTRVTPEPGARYVVTAGTVAAPAGARSLGREALLDALVERSTPAPGRLARLLGKKPALPQGAALVLDATVSAPPRDLLEWLALLQTRGVDMCWSGHEGGRGLVHTFARPRQAGERVLDALLAHARDAALDLGPEGQSNGAAGRPSPDADCGMLVAGAPTRGYWQRVSLAALAAEVHGGTGTWLDPGTPHARLGYQWHIPGARIVEALHAHLDEPTVVGVAARPDLDAAVLVYHLVGGIDRRRGEVVGFTLERVWS